VTACHECSDGGLLVAIAEMAMAGNLGATVAAPDKAMVPHAFWFGEDQARYVLSVTKANADKVVAAAKSAGVPVARLGETGGAAIALDGHGRIAVADLKSAHEAFFPNLMKAG
jgi:phosphoribosylformylglycinamidine synthase